MGFLELFVLAVGLSMDAFAISICKGLSVQKVKVGQLLSAGIWFGGFQALMPLLGFLLGSAFSDMVASVDHWISFILLALIGANMIKESRGEVEKTETSFGPLAMFPLAIADSIDALAVGVSFAFMKVDIVPAIIVIGITTFAFSVAGVKIGNVFGARYKSKAELAGGVILIAIGLYTLIDGLGIL